jgi:hypothetical protein
VLAGDLTFERNWFEALVVNWNNELCRSPDAGSGFSQRQPL